MLKLNGRALPVQTRAGTLPSRQRGQTHPLEQLRGLFMEHGSPIVGRGRT
jgi:hypothetical protein